MLMADVEISLKKGFRVEWLSNNKNSHRPTVYDYNKRELKLCFYIIYIFFHFGWRFHLGHAALFYLNIYYVDFIIHTYVTRKT